jgi:uncharacterized membrane protein YphA (DoxX/SURF4 family)
MSSIPIPAEKKRKALHRFLWVAQVLVAVAFIVAGLAKGFTPVHDLAQKMPWTGDVPIWFLHSIAVIDLAGGLGILLPALTRIRPRLTVWAALGCSALQVCAIAFHLSRGEGAVIPANIVLLGLSLFILWGRHQKVPIKSRM